MYRDREKEEFYNSACKGVVTPPQPLTIVRPQFLKIDKSRIINIEAVDMIADKGGGRVQVWLMGDEWQEMDVEGVTMDEVTEILKPYGLIDLTKAGKK